MKNILITGSTDGIGRLLARKLVLEGHSVYVHGRNPEKVETVVSELQQLSKNKNIKGYIADFSNLEAVRKMTEEIKSDLEKIDILINNAGIFTSPIHLNKTGIDIRLVVNYLAPYLFTEMLLPTIRRGGNPRIINLSSAAQSTVSLNALAGKEKLSVNDAYAQSKLALTMWSLDLAVNHSDINVIAVNPGSLLNTKMANEAYGQHWSPAEKGVNILHELALSKKHETASGKYFDNDRGTFGKAHPDAYNKGLIKELLEVTEKLTK